MAAVGDWLKGKKTYILGALLVVYVVSASLGGWEPDDTIVYGLVGAMGITLRSGVKKAERDVRGK